MGEPGRRRRIAAPQAEISDADRERGLRTLTIEVAFSTTADSFIGGVMLTAFALYLGASSSAIGLLAAVIFWNQLWQGPGVLLIDRLRRRKVIAVAGSIIMGIAPLLMLGLAFAPHTLPTRLALVAIIMLYGGAGAIAGCAWNAWIRDLVPGDRRGRFFGRRSTLGTATSITAGLLAAWLLDREPEGSPDRHLVFAGLFVVAFVAAMLSAATLARVPEPKMPETEEHPRLRAMFGEALSNSRFRQWVTFFASWQFAVNLAQPFFTLFFLRQLGFGMTFVMALTLIYQLANLLTLSRWGWFADRYKSKSVLNVAAPTFLLCILGMIGASQLGAATVTQVYLVVLHLILGAAAAGVSLASSNMVMKLSPRGSAETYLAANALLSAMAAGIAPLLGGFAQDFFAAREFGLVLQWTGPVYQGDVRLSVTAWDFYFLISALVGLYALHRLALVHEEGELERGDMLREMREQSLIRHIMAEGLSAIGQMPANLARRRTGRRDAHRRQ